MGNPNIKEAGKKYQWRTGQSGNPKGKPKGSKSLATIIRELEFDDFNWDIIPWKQKELNKVERFKKIGSPFKVITMVAIRQAAKGDNQAREWLRKSGYGDKLDLTTMGKELPTPILGGTSVNIPTDNGSKETPGPPKED